MIDLNFCKGKDNLIVKYAFRSNTFPVIVPNFETQLAKAFPDNFKKLLPSIEVIEAKLGKPLHHIVEVDQEDEVLCLTWRAS